jgi:hypothetical protein
MSSVEQLSQSTQSESLRCKRQQLVPRAIFGVTQASSRAIGVKESLRQFEIRRKYLPPDDAILIGVSTWKTIVAASLVHFAGAKFRLLDGLQVRSVVMSRSRFHLFAERTRSIPTNGILMKDGLVSLKDKAESGQGRQGCTVPCADSSMYSSRFSSPKGEGRTRTRTGLPEPQYESTSTKCLH